MLHLIIKLIIKKGCIIMKKTTTLLLSLGMLASTSAVIYLWCNCRRNKKQRVFAT